MQVQRVSSRFGTVQVGIVITAMVTAFIHWYLVASIIRMGMNPLMFVLNGLGYLSLLAALFLPQTLVDRLLSASLARAYRPVIRYTMMGYTLLTILLWTAMGERSIIAYVDKIAEVFLVVLLWMDRSR